MKVFSGLKLNKFEYVKVPSRRQMYNRMLDCKIRHYTQDAVEGIVDLNNVRKTDIEDIRLHQSAPQPFASVEKSE